eukprot:4053892-Prymnesium_polylepis.1
MRVSSGASGAAQPGGSTSLRPCRSQGGACESREEPKEPKEQQEQQGTHGAVRSTPRDRQLVCGGAI